MPVTLKEQDAIQLHINLISPEDRDELRRKAILEIEDIRHLLQIKHLSKDEMHRYSLAIETLVRIDGQIMGKGALFRFFRRFYYTFKYRQ